MTNFLRDENNKLSSTRLVLVSMVAAFWTAMFVEVPTQVWPIIQATILLCLGGNAVRTTVFNK